ncbi:MAG: aldo/keto reductase [Syntrophobacterales bacterium]|jgi:aryl-alcohol dehydrogenase-like predicted oxidoreductase
MRYKLLGKSGLRVSELCLGAMTFGDEWGWGASKDESRRVYETFLEAGGNFIDTANAYTEGSSERFLGEFMEDHRENVVLATKYTLSGALQDPNSAGNHRKSMMQAVEASLRRLKTDYIDLYWLHCWDFFTPVEEIMRAFDDLVRQGKVLYIGVSDAPAWIVSRANTMAELRGWTAFVGLQIEYSLIERTVERELLPMARELDLGVTAWSPLAGGLLTGKYSRPGAEGDERRLEHPMLEGLSDIDKRKLAIVEAVQSVAQDIGSTEAQVALAWLRQQQGVVIPIVGARTATQLKDNLGCLGVTLDSAHLERLDEASRIDLGFPHDFFKSDLVRQLVYGGMRDSIDNHREKGK